MLTLLEEVVLLTIDPRTGQLRGDRQYLGPLRPRRSAAVRPRPGRPHRHRCRCGHRHRRHTDRQFHPG